MPRNASAMARRSRHPLARLGRRLRIRTRGRIALIDTTRLPLPARGSAARPDRAADEPRGREPPRHRAHLALRRREARPILATRPDVVGAALARDLETLQDKMAPFPQAEAEREVEAALGKPLRELFASFGPPVAAASIAQVHRAEVVAGGGRHAVAVKVLRPGVERRFGRSRRVHLRRAQRRAAVPGGAPPAAGRWSKRSGARSPSRWIWLRRPHSEMAENTRNDPDFRVPAVNWDRTARDVLTLEWIEATPLSDRARLEAKGFDLQRLARAVIQTSAPRAARRLLPRRCIPAICSSTMPASWSPSTSASWDV